MVDEEHSHCWKCVLGRRCFSDNGCPTIPCANCSVPMHACKSSEHVNLVCLETVVPCVNAQHGCPVKIKRKDMHRHLQFCPSWVLQCRFSYERFHRERTFEPDSTEMFPDEQFLASDLEFACTQHASRLEASSSSEVIREEKENSGPSEHVDKVLSRFKYMDIFCFSYSLGKDFWKNRNRHQAKQNLSGKRCHIYYTKDSHPYAHWYPAKTLDVHRFICGQFVKRHEWADHYINHHELEINLPLFAISHCPLRNHGCNYAVVPYHLRSSDTQLNYSKEVHSFLVSSLGNIMDEMVSSEGVFAAELAKKKELALYGYEEEGSLDPLGQLPPEVLLRILVHLDSLSLWCLSQVNQFFREVCRTLLVKKGMVLCQWYKEGKGWKQDTPVRLWII